eukprot:COSAG04_NODE_14760_length_556_cov_0.689278_1_plen_37_part_10
MSAGKTLVWVPKDGIYEAASVLVHEAGDDSSEVETAA